MASVSTSSTCAADGHYGLSASFTVTESGTNTAGNYSTVSWHLVVKGTTTGGYTFGGHTRSHAGWVYCAVNGSTVWSGYTGMPNGMYNGQTLIDVSGTTNVAHDNDGKKTCSFFVDLDASDDDWGKINWYFNDGARSTGSLTLTAIARASQPSINTYPANSPDITAGTACTVHMNRKASFTHSISWSFGTLSGQTSGFAKTSGIADNVSWTPPASMMAQIPNAKTGTGTITVTTYSGSTTIGTKTVSFTLHQPSDAAPSLSASYAESGTLADGKTTLASKGVSGTTVIGQISKKVITVTASAKYSSTLKSITCTHNGNTQTASGSPASFTFEAPVNTGDSKSYFSWTATDSRGNVSSGSVSMDFVDYKKPVTASITPVRDSAVASTGTVKVTGTFYNGKVGNVTNDIKVTIAYGKTVTPSVTKSGSNWSCSSTISDVSPSGSYTFKVTAVDSLGYSAPALSVVLQKAQPTLWIGKDTVRINNHLMVEGMDMRVGGSTAFNNVTVSSFISSIESLPACSGSVIFSASGTIAGKTIPASKWYLFRTLVHRTGGPDSDNGKYMRLHFETLSDSVFTTMDFQLKSGTWSVIVPGYPVGAIYISVNSTSPAALFGGTWTEVGKGKVLWGADSSHSAGSSIDAGLPNISGGVQVRQWADTNLVAVQGSGDSGAKSGPFTYTHAAGSKWGNQDTGVAAASGNNDLITFNAQQANSIYGKSSTVQPPAYVVHMWQRTA